MSEEQTNVATVEQTTTKARGLPEAGENDLVCVRSLSIEGQGFERGAVLGRVDGDKPVSTVEGVTVGHLAARLRRGLLQVGPLAEEPPPLVEPVNSDSGQGGGVEPIALPDDFPGKPALEAAGHTTLDAVAKLTEDDLVAIDGIGKSTAEKVRAAVNAASAPEG